MKKKSERNFEKPCIYAFTHSVFPSKTIPDSRQKWAKSILVFRPNGAKTPPDREAHTYMAYIRENPPPGVFLTLGYSIRHAATAYSFPYIKVDSH